MAPNTVDWRPATLLGGCRVYANGWTRALKQQRVTLKSRDSTAQHFTWTGQGEGGQPLHGDVDNFLPPGQGDQPVAYLCTVENRASDQDDWAPSQLRGFFSVQLQNFYQLTLISEDETDHDFNDTLFNLRWWGPRAPTSVELTRTQAEDPFPRSKEVLLEALGDWTQDMRIQLLTGKPPQAYRTYEGIVHDMQPLPPAPQILTTAKTETQLIFQYKAKPQDKTWTNLVAEGPTKTTDGPYHQHTWAAHHTKDPLDQTHLVLCVHWWDT